MSLFGVVEMEERTTCIHLLTRATCVLQLFSTKLPDGFIPCLQPTDSFGRIYAAYGGFFIVLSFLFGWALDGDKPDLGDVIGGSIALAGVFVVMFWPR